MATQEQLEREKLLQQAFSQFGGDTPAEPAAAPQRDVRAERLAEEAAATPIPLPRTQPVAAPTQPIPGSREILLAQQERARQNLLAQQALSEKQSRSITDRPRTKFLKKGQSFMDAFTDPSEAQRAFAFNAGIALLSSNGTNDLSQRIGQALGSGMQGMQATRQAELDAVQKANESEMKLLQMQQQGIGQEMGFTKELSAMDAASAQAALAADERLYQRQQDALKRNDTLEANRLAESRRVADEVRENRRREEDLELRKKAADQKQENFLVTETRLGQPKPPADTKILQTFNEANALRGQANEALKAGNQDLAARLNFQADTLDKSAVKQSTFAQSSRQTIQNSDGTFSIIETIGAPAGEGRVPTSQKYFGKANSQNDAKQLDEALTVSIKAQAANAQNDRWLNLLDEGMKTGLGSPLATSLGQASVALGQFGLGIPFADDDRLQNEITQRETAVAISSEMGAARLEMFGGNDSERELLVALAMAPGVDKSREGNYRILRNNKIATKILANRHNFMQRWISSNDSLNNQNEQGLTFSQAWGRYQREEFKKAGGKINRSDYNEVGGMVNDYQTKVGKVNIYGEPLPTNEVDFGSSNIKSNARAILSN